MDNNIVITNKEFEAYCGSGNYYVSDIDYGLNPETKEWDIPVVEWESCMGRYRKRYESEEARDSALRVNELDMERFILTYRNEEAKRKLEKLQEKMEIQNMKTLGGMFPQLELLKSKF